MRKKILLVDDEVIIGAYLSNFLRNAGYEVETASTGSEGVAKSRNFVPDLILLDLLLPDDDGLQVLKKVKQEFPAMPVIIVTGIAPDEEILKECRDNAADGFVTKDSTVDHLLMHVKRFLP
ncbi:MAG: response regulator [Verrucomicrobiales bacterium]